MDDDDRRSNVGGAESGVEASPAPEVGEASGRELELRAQSLRARDTHNVPERIRGEGEGEEGDVDRRP
ncbi:MAG TPA: hypothetical protein VFJ16_30775 [Longimicrobium sp.]|nr:hypothetical protein [Longimicrobium sp.]